MALGKCFIFLRKPGFGNFGNLELKYIKLIFACLCPQLRKFPLCRAQLFPCRRIFVEQFAMGKSSKRIQCLALKALFKNQLIGARAVNIGQILAQPAQGSNRSRRIIDPNLAAAC